MNQSEFLEELAKISIFPTELQLSQLEKYYELLIEYNKVINLTSITKKEDVYLKHFYDSLTITKSIDLTKIDSLCDFGTGAGFPGLVLKIMYPNLNITLIDSLNKRIKFLNDVIEQLNLQKIITIHSRVEEYGIKNKNIYDVVTARAVAQLNVLLEYAIPLVKVNGYFIAMKGSLEKEANIENATKKLKCIIENKVNFKLPIEKSTRTILKIRKIKLTPKLFPRKYSEIKRNPL